MQCILLTWFRPLFVLCDIEICDYDKNHAWNICESSRVILKIPPETTKLISMIFLFGRSTLFTSWHAFTTSRSGRRRGLALVVQICTANCFGLFTSSSFQVLFPSHVRSRSLCIIMRELILVLFPQCWWGGKRDRAEDQNRISICKLMCLGFLTPHCPQHRLRLFAIFFSSFSFLGYDFLQKVLGRRNWLRIFAFQCWTWIAFGIRS